MRWLVFPTAAKVQEFKDIAGARIKERRRKSEFLVGRQRAGVKQPKRDYRLQFHKVGQNGPWLFKVSHDIAHLLSNEYPQFAHRPELPEQAQGGIQRADGLIEFWPVDNEVSDPVED